ncbi:hypothetical protein [Haloterrigena alkaliphila]|uniref:Uncharacterized protein n=1 Tax=Haloterrigena alkaliphila TaxID=2816475 RepID=A0A8A2VEX4_9EURY|nr:hypothetical protein [Haloterrigena alkaliphila]QSX00062.1 hypothetical protein J0X25_03590 [Haloterrigena alkaliphila]
MHGGAEDVLERARSALDFPTDDLGIEEPPEDVDSVLASSETFRPVHEERFREAGAQFD